MNKKFDRLRQWAGERMGGEVRTSLSDDFKALEAEMNVKHDAIDRIHKAMLAYIKSISKRSEGEDREKCLSIAHLGGSMVSHGEDYNAYSEYGRSLAMLGKTEERLARVQENYINQATSTYLESLEKSLAQMKEYQAARKKLDSRRLAYDTSLSKIQKAKKEDFRAEEELQEQKLKYEESNDDVYRRMLDIKDSEVKSTVDIAAFLDAQLSYHQTSLEILLQLKDEWPGAQTLAQAQGVYRPGRTQSIDFRKSSQEGSLNVPGLRSIISNNMAELSAREDSSPGISCKQFNTSRPSYTDGPVQGQEQRQRQGYEESWPSRRTSESYTGRRAQSQVPTVSRLFSDPFVRSLEADSPLNTDFDYTHRGRSASPTVSSKPIISWAANAGATSSTLINKKAPPPPPPRPPRSRRPPPPPPPSSTTQDTLTCEGDEEGY